MSKRDRILWGFFVGLVTLALAGSLWAFAWKSGCGGCEGTSGHPAGRALAGAGVAYYAILLGAALLTGPSPFLFGGVLLAAGAHGVLIVLLLARGALCPPCLLTGAAAISAMAVSFFLEGHNLARAGVLLPAAALGTHLLLFSTGLASAVPPSPIEIEKRIPAEVRAAPQSPSSQARLIAFTRPDCGYCLRLERDFLPEIEREFGSRMTVELRSAEAFAGMPVPTILITGPAGRKYFGGLPAFGPLRRAILDVLGADHERQAMLPSPR